MNDRDTIIRMAREAGGLPDPMVFIGAYERFAALVAATERKACAAICDALWDQGVPGHANDCAAAIRARSEK